MGRICCATIVRNEARHLAEWLAWQIILGFDTILLLDNGSTDGTAAIARGFAPTYDVRVADYTNRDVDWQFRGFEQLARQAAAEGFEWLAFFDADEFLRLDEGETLKSLLAARPEAAIAVPWAFFGSNGHKEFPPGLVVESFDRRSDASFLANAHVKSIIRPDRMQAIVNSHAFQMRGDYVDLRGRPVRWGALPGLLDTQPDYAGGMLNHYFTRSAAHWREKLARGYPDLTRKQEEFLLYDRNEVLDRRLAVRAGEIRALLAGLRPAASAAPRPRKAPGTYRYVLATCARWETPYVAEWLSYHRALGFEHVYLYCNDDDPAALYEAVFPFLQGGEPFVTFHHHRQQGAQREMLMHYAANYREESEWVALFDLDEFLRLPEGQDLHGYMQGFAERTDCLMFNWLSFGPNGYQSPPPSVLRNLTRRENKVHPCTKLIARTYALGLPELFANETANGFVHRLQEFVDTALRPMNVLGEDMSLYYQDFPAGAVAWLAQDQRGERLLASNALLHHYAFRTEGAFAERVARGLAGVHAGQAAWGELAKDEARFRGFLQSLNAVEDMALAARRGAQLALPAGADVTHLAVGALPAPPKPPPGRGKVAVVLMVKDEASDILGWLAWYRMLGADAAIVYDDGSTDGTWDILQNASRNFDIRLHRAVGARDSLYDYRQLASYQDAATRYRDAFEWLGFFDADEYLLLHQDATIPAMLERLRQAEQICIAWCQFGSSGHALKPAEPAPLAYVWRGTEADAVNRHVKSFVRTQAVGPAWDNVHVFDVAAARSVLADGSPVVFGESRGILAGPPDWRVARVAHYQCRSLEHYLERIRRRPNFQNIPWLWAALDVRAVRDEAALAHAPALRENLAALTARPAPGAPPGVAPPPAPPGESVYLIARTDPALVQAALDQAPLVVAVQPDVRQFYALSETFAGAVAAGRLKLENAAPAAHGGDIVLYSPPDGGQAYHVVTIDWAELQAKYGAPASLLMAAPVAGFPALPA